MTAKERAEADILRRSGRLEEAEALLAAAPVTPKNLGALAEVQFERREFARCDKTLSQLIALAPLEARLDTFRQLAKVRWTTGGSEAASEVMRQALKLHPGDTDFVAAYADTLPFDEAVAVLTHHLTEIGDEPSRTAYTLRRLTLLRAPHVRANQGLPHYGTSWPDTYRWPDAGALGLIEKTIKAELAGGSTRVTALLDLAYIALAEGDWETVEKYLAQVRHGEKRTPADFTAFGAAFHEGLAAMTEADIFCGLVPVQRLAAPEPPTGPVIYIASDERYFAAFTVPFLRQLDGAKFSLDVHIHLLDGTGADWAAARELVGALSNLRITLTAEASGVRAGGNDDARTYYHSVRYVRFYAELKRSQIPMWILDCDVTLQGDPRPLFESLARYDLALRSAPCHFEPNLKMCATCVGVSPTPRGMEFVRRLAASVIYWKDRGTWNWGIDQIGMLSVYAYMSTVGREPNTLFLDDTAMNNAVGDTAPIRFMSGIRKHIES